jgi:hypothetical protein
MDNIQARYNCIEKGQHPFLLFIHESMPSILRNAAKETKKKKQKGWLISIEDESLGKLHLPSKYQRLKS